MRLLLVRHAIAMDRDEFAETGRPDAERPLTPDGREKMRRTAAGLALLVPAPAILASSPLVRALETTALLAKEWPDADREITAALSPESPHAEFTDWYRKHASRGLVAAVGHEPHLSGLASWLMTRRASPVLEFKKGGAALLEFDGRIGAGLAQLRWLLAPGQLRMLAHEP